MAYQIIFFDLDGTIVDPKDGITNAVQYALEKFGIIEDQENLIKFIGPPLKYSFQQYYNFNEEQALQAIEYYRKKFIPEGLQKSIVYNGIEKLLDKLQKSGIQLYIVSSKPSFASKQIITYHGLNKYFKDIVGVDKKFIDVDKSTRIKEALLLEPKKPKNTIVMIGDREHDIIGAQANGIDSIGVLYGYGTEDEINNIKPTYIAKNIEDLEKLLLTNVHL